MTSSYQEPSKERLNFPGKTKTPMTNIAVKPSLRVYAEFKTLEQTLVKREKCLLQYTTTNKVPEKQNK